LNVSVSTPAPPSTDAAIPSIGFDALIATLSAVAISAFVAGAPPARVVEIVTGTNDGSFV
jgi:hypothetical protein